MNEKEDAADTAAYVHSLMDSIDFATPDFDRDYPSAELTFRMKEMIPDCLFLRLRVSLAIPMDDGSETDETRKTQFIDFVITDATLTSSAPAEYVVAMCPRPRTGYLDDDRKAAFLALADGAGMHRRKDGSPRDWRDEVSGIRFFHEERPDDGYVLRNPRYEALPVADLSTLLASLPRNGRSESDDVRDLNDLIASADDAFSDPDATPIRPRPTRPRSESFGYDVYMLHGPGFIEAFEAIAELSEIGVIEDVVDIKDFEEFDLDAALRENAA